MSPTLKPGKFFKLEEVTVTSFSLEGTVQKLSKYSLFNLNTYFVESRKVIMMASQARSRRLMGVTEWMEGENLVRRDYALKIAS